MIDTSTLVGGPIKRYGGKGQIAPRLVPHFARAKVWCEPFFGAGSVFYALPAGSYQRHAVNDLDASIVTFFRVLRDRPDELINACELTPCARDEFRVAMERSPDDLEEARRVWIRSRQGFGGSSVYLTNWKRDVGDAHAWAPSQIESKLTALRSYAAALRGVAVDNIDACEFVERWGRETAFIYADPPYVHETRSFIKARKDYEHEMSETDHRRLAAALHIARDSGARCAISGYPSALYDELFAGWRVVEIDVASCAARGAATRRTEVLWCSYPATDALGYVAPDGPLFGTP